MTDFNTDFFDDY